MLVLLFAVKCAPDGKQSHLRKYRIRANTICTGLTYEDNYPYTTVDGSCNTVKLELLARSNFGRQEKPLLSSFSRLAVNHESGAKTGVMSLVERIEGSLLRQRRQQLKHDNKHGL